MSAPPTFKVFLWSPRTWMFVATARERSWAARNQAAFSSGALSGVPQFHRPGVPGWRCFIGGRIPGRLRAFDETAARLAQQDVADDPVVPRIAEIVPLFVKPALAQILHGGLQCGAGFHIVARTVMSHRDPGTVSGRQDTGSADRRPRLRPALSRTCHEDHARARPRADEAVLRLRRAVDEVPRLQRPLLALDQQHALPSEDEEVLLVRLAVIPPAGLSRLEHGQREADVAGRRRRRPRRCRRLREPRSSPTRPRGH